MRGKRRKHRPPVPFRRCKRGLACPVLLVILCGPAAAQQTTSFSNFGSTGLLDMPSATMLPDGNLVLNASYMLDAQHYNITFQALPWLETSFRYSGLTHFDPSYPVYWDRAFGVKVRLWEEGDVLPSVAVGVNDLVGTGIYSGEYLVATKNIGDIEVTVGMGWGRMASANAFRNPLSIFSKSFDDRATGYSGQGGEFSFGKYFHGPASVFGGFAWNTPIENLTLKAEYSSDAYSAETANGGFRPRNQFNFGAAYRVYDNIILGANWMYGRSFGGSITFDLSPATNSFPQRMEPNPVPLNFRSPSEQAMALQVLKGHGSQPLKSTAASSGDDLWRLLPDLHNVAITGTTLELTLAAVSQDMCARAVGQIDALALDVTSIVIRNDAGTQLFRCTARSSPLQFAQMTYRPDGATGIPASALAEPLLINAVGPTRESQAKAAAKLRLDANGQNIRIETLSMQQGTLTIYYTNSRYQAEAEAVDKLLRVAMADAPPEIEQFRFIAIKGGTPLAEYKILRTTAERTFQQESNYDLLTMGSGPFPAPMPDAIAPTPKGSYPRFSWVVFPQVRQEFFDPSNPLGLQLVAGAYGGVELFRGFSLTAEVETSIFDTFGTSRVSDSVLPHVRTDFLQYIVHGKTGMGALTAEYQFRLSPTVYGLVRAGYLESMFAGVGGEILWRPEGQRWALGADLYEVKQRAFDRLFGFLPYRQTTGHVTLYYDSPWYDLNFQLRAGQYLAGDRGFTFQVERRFSTGVEIGVFATKTNVSSARFGEGSFDKGIFLHIPLDWVLPTHSQISLDELIRPVQRDGGQALAGDATLYAFTNRNSEASARLIKWN